MAAVTYYMHIRDGSFVIGESDVVNQWPNPAPGMHIASASFSSISEDTPDVLTPLGRPLNRATYEGTTYTPPADPTKPYIKQTWSGDGTLVGDVYEMTPHGANVATLTLQKWDENADAPINTGGEVLMLRSTRAARSTGSVWEV